MTEQAIVIQDLWRTYTSTRGLWKTTRVRRDALRGISLQVERGELFGLLGPNGAGKTTLVKILSTILLPTAGQAAICGYDIQREVSQVRQRIGIVFGGERGFHPRLTARQNLHYWAALYHLERSQAQRRIAELLELVGLAQRADERTENFSRGMKQRLHFARGLLHHPQVLFLDEPSLGLDPVAALAMRTLIKDLQSQGMTIFLTTHYMQEAETLCDRVAFLKDGEIIILDSPRMISRTAATCREIEATVVGQQAELLQMLEHQPYLRAFSLEQVDAACILRLQLTQEDALPALLRTLADLPVTHVVSREPGLEDVYVQLLGDRKMAVPG